MGSLSNLYISQSYISLLHLGSNNTASATMTDLQDGLGNSISVSVNTQGAISASGISLNNTIVSHRGLEASGTIKFNTAYTSSTPTYVNSGNFFTDSIIRITGSFASGSAISPTVNEVQIGWPVYGNGLVSGAVVTNKQYVNSQFVELTINQNTAVWFGNYYFTNPTTLYDNVSVSGSQDITGSLWIRDTLSVTNISASGNISASNLWIDNTIHAYKLDVTIESSSIIFTSGSNILGDEANIDTQTLIGRVIVSGSLEVTGSTRINGNTTITGSTIISGTTTINGNTTITGSNTISGSSNLIGTTTINGNTTITGSLTLSSSAETELSVIGNSLFLGTTNITGSLNVSGSMICIGSEIVSGSLEVTGSMVYSGSVRGQVVPLTISSNTASMDCTKANFFTLTIPSGSTRIVASNIKPGETISLRTTQTSAVGNLSFTNILFPSGSRFTPTFSSGAIDIVTFISFDTSSLYGVGVNNFNV